MPAEMQMIKLQELCEVVTKGTTPTTLGKSFSNQGINFIKAESILNNHSFDRGRFSYIDGDTFVFMDQDTYEQFELAKDDLGDYAGYITPDVDLEINLTFYEGSPVGIDLPVRVTRQVTYCEPGVKGDTSGKSMKPATLDTGIEVRVPLFINTDDKIVIDTRDGSFLERAKD